MSDRTTALKLVCSEDFSPQSFQEDFSPHYKPDNGYFTGHNIIRS